MRSAGTRGHRHEESATPHSTSALPKTKAERHDSPPPPPRNLHAEVHTTTGILFAEPQAEGSPNHRAKVRRTTERRFANRDQPVAETPAKTCGRGMQTNANRRPLDCGKTVKQKQKSSSVVADKQTKETQMGSDPNGKRGQKSGGRRLHECGLIPPPRRTGSFFGRHIQTISRFFPNFARQTHNNP